MSENTSEDNLASLGTETDAATRYFHGSVIPANNVWSTEKNARGSLSGFKITSTITAQDAFKNHSGQHHEENEALRKLCIEMKHTQWNATARTMPSHQEYDTNDNGTGSFGGSNQSSLHHRLVLQQIHPVHHQVHHQICHIQGKRQKTRSHTLSYRWNAYDSQCTWKVIHRLKGKAGKIKALAMWAATSLSLEVWASFWNRYYNRNYCEEDTREY